MHVRSVVQTLGFITVLLHLLEALHAPAPRLALQTKRERRSIRIVVGARAPRLRCDYAGSVLPLPVFLLWLGPRLSDIRHVGGRPTSEHSRHGGQAEAYAREAGERAPPIRCGRRRRVLFARGDNVDTNRHWL